MGEPAPEPKPIITANSIAKEFFQSDLQFQQGDGDKRATEATVILHDSCYGHRYSRPPRNPAQNPAQTRLDLTSIVERPERLKACALGIAMAYVRLGDRHADGENFIHPKVDPTTIPHLPFRIRRAYSHVSLLSPAVVAVHGKEPMEELKTLCNSTLSKFATDRIEVERDQSSKQNPKPEFHAGDLYLGPHSLEAMEGAIGAVCEAVDAVFGSGPSRAFVAVRPPGHHCSADYPSGFCWVNNVHVGIAHAMMNHGLTHVAIIDFDLHHGDGSQTIAWNHNHRHTYSKGKSNLSQWKKGPIGYFSLHDVQSYPCESGDIEKTMNASVCIEDSHGQNIWNVHLKHWKNKTEFWELYETRYSILLEKAEEFLKRQSDRLRAAGKTPKSAIFLSAGFDASEWESGGMQRHIIGVPTDFYARVTQDVVKIAEDPQTGADGRIISVMEGGYSDRAIYSGVCSHLSGLASTPSARADDGPPAADHEASQPRAQLGVDMGQRLGLAPGNALAGQDDERDRSSTRAYDPEWWSSTELDALEHVIGMPTPEPKRPRNSLPPTYCSPTHASTARAADPVRLHRSLHKNGQLSRPPTPPPPEVPWTIAVQELHNLLVPEDRPTASCTVEEIYEIVALAKKDYRSVTPATQLRSPTASEVPTPTSVQRAGLRTRKPKPVEAIYEDEKNLKAPVVRRSNRRASTASVLTTVERDDMAPAATVESGISNRGRSRVSDVGGPTSLLQAKKARAAPTPAPTPRKEAAKKPPARPAPQKRASSTTVAKGSAKAGGPQPPAAIPTASGAAKKPEIRVSGSGAQRDQKPSLVDSITAGMNKIKITIVNKSGQGAQALGGSKAGSAAPEAGAPTVSAPKRRIKIVQNGSRQQSPRSSLEGPRSEEPSRSDDGSRQAAGQSPIPSISTPVSAGSPNALSPPLPASSPATEQPGPEPTTPDLFVQYQPNGPTPEAIPLKDELNFLPPNVGTPTPTPMPMKRADLPTFTSTSAIPFATAEEPADGRLNYEEEGSIWEVQESPSKPGA
ncbi:related to histone deacetylase HOS3 [Cephalotrichum gorgonifer]|uniref:Related to histone deacetylase HOS3 n=1 Tax=Cephalotrichum gorgonifer TaxID=2041049 RepID=A0AAE8SYK5_9PEZI|nr:related to histone deacetylase HOS3 [Cephalotrichum gorgonifer]